MKNFYFKRVILLLFFIGISHYSIAQKTYPQIPISYQTHPEYGKTSHPSTLKDVDYELLQARTPYSKTYLNTNTTKTTVQSSVPLHYLDENNRWVTIDYKLRNANHKISYPAQNPFFEMGNNEMTIKVDHQTLKIKKQNDFIFVSNNAILKKISSVEQNATIENDNQIVYKNIAPNLDKNITLYPQAFKYDFIIKNANFLPQEFDYMLAEETLVLPDGFSLREEKTTDNRTSSISLINQNGQVVLTFQQPAISDSKTFLRTMRQSPYTGSYQLIQLNETTYKLQIKIDGTWLQSSERVYPITIDPVVTVTNNTNVNSCFLPTYQQSTLQATIPAGQSVLSTNISYDFVAVAGSNAWMSDQRSFVSGPNGQTPVTNGVGNTAGTYTYTITDSPIGNVVSTGQVNYTFNFGRNWGGSGCDATFNFVSRHEVVVTYGALEFGNGPLVVNEYSASNRNFNDGFGRNEDWIELYNASPTTYFNLAGYYLSNNINNPTKWQIQEGVIPPNSRVLVFCSSRNIASGTVLHASFDLTQTDADEIVIADPSGTIIESLQMFVTQTNHSYGRTTDGASTWRIYSTPTPGTQNTNGFTNYSTKPILSVAAGRYTGPVTVSISSTGTNEQIRYTTNGSTPTATSTLYTGPITISQNTVLRARTFSTVPSILPGFIETNTYFINDTSTLPVVSISGDANLSQLLNGTRNEPTGYLEYFNANGTLAEENMGDFDSHGNDSWAYPQRGIDYIARDDHGYKRRLNHPFFNTTDRTKFRRLILKAAGSDNYPHQDGGAHMRDVFAQKLSEVANLELDERRSTFVLLYVNGQYWGVYDLREKVDDNQYTDYYYGQDYIFRDSNEYIQYIKTWGATNPEFGNQPAITAWDDLMDYIQDNDMAIEANYNYVDSQLNIDSLIDYFVLNSYLVNKDWLNWNTSWWRGTNPSGGALKWRYSLWDMDGILGHYTNFTGIPDITAGADPCNVENLNVGVGHAQTIEKLITQSPVVRQRYIARYADLLNTHLSCQSAIQLFDNIVAQIAPEMPRQIQRWGGNMTEWQANVQEARTFLQTRCSQTISSGLVSCYNVTGPFTTNFQVSPASTGRIKMNSEWIANFPYTAQIFGNLQTLLKAEAFNGYQFSHWEVDGAVIQPDPNNPDITLQISQATNVTAFFTEVLNPEQSLYYWHFNNLNTPNDIVSIPADFNLIPGTSPLMTYTGTGPRDIDTNNTGSILNTNFSQPSGKSARVRNPSDGRSLVFDLPTTGYRDIKFAYAVQRTNEGQLNNSIAYSIDGINFIQTGISPNSFVVNTDFRLIQIDLSSIAEVNNNPNFKIRITFAGNTSGETGNNRFDNVTLKGVVNNLSVPTQNITTYQVFPNPFTETLQVLTKDPINELRIYDVVGKEVWQKTINNTSSETLTLDSLTTGVYFLKIKTTNGLITHKLIKQ